MMMMMTTVLGGGFEAEYAESARHSAGIGAVLPSTADFFALATAAHAHAHLFAGFLVDRRELVFVSYDDDDDDDNECALGITESRSCQPNLLLAA